MGARLERKRQQDDPQVRRKGQGYRSLYKTDGQGDRSLDQRLPAPAPRLHDSQRAVYERTQGNLLDEQGPLHAAVNFTTYPNQGCFRTMVVA